MKNGKIITCLVSCLCIICLSGCREDLTKRAYNGIDDTNNKTVSEQGNRYKVNTLKFDVNEINDNEDFCDNSLYYKNQNIYYSTIYAGDNEDTRCYRIYRYSIEKEMSEMIFSFEAESETNVIPQNIVSLEVLENEDVLVYFCSSVYEETKDINYRHIDKCIYSANGELVSKVSLEDDAGISIAAKCFTDTEGNTYVNTIDEETAAYNILIRYDSQGKKTARMELDYMLSEVLTPTNQIISGINDTSDDHVAFAYLDLDNNKKDIDSFKAVNDIEEMYKVLTCYKDIVYFAGRTYVYSYNVNNQEVNRVINCSDVNIDFLNTLYFERIDEDRFLCINNNDINGYSELEFLVLEKTNKSEDNRVVVSVASIYENDSDIKNIINKFNKNNKEYSIEYISYGMDGENPINAFNKDIASGNIPDIYLIDEMDVNNLINKEMLENLTPYIEKDGVVNRDYFTDGYLEATAIEGKQYFLNKSFYITTLCGYGKELYRYKDDWNFLSLARYYGSNSKGTMLFEDALGKELFYKLAEGCISDYIDWETGKCSFESESFRQLLELCYVANIAGNTENEKPTAVKIRDREILFDNRRIGCLYDIANNNVVFDGDAFYVGYPWSNGGVCLKTDGSTFAISSGSDKKEAAWNIIKEFLTGEYNRYDHEYGRGGCIPTSSKEFDMMVKDSSISSDYIAEDGVKVKYAIESSECNVTLEPTGDEELAVMKELINRARYQPDYNRECEVIMEEVEDYLNDKRSLDDTINLIQDKMTKYVNENR